MGVLRVAGPAAGPGLRAEARLSADRLSRGIVAAGAVVLTGHLIQHVVEGIGQPAWFFGLGIVGAAGLWATAILWPRGSAPARTLVLAILGVGLVWGGLAEHLRTAADEGLTATHATGVLAGGIGLALLALAAIRLFAGGPPDRLAGDFPDRRS